uniref:Axoneme-like protein n=1 Tax=Karlodinium veneficum TaxID=407301 RepID=B8XIJ7_KARVE|nr:axoneme-like protein [Karlodinium veneficum]
MSSPEKKQKTSDEEAVTSMEVEAGDEKACLATSDVVVDVTKQIEELEQQKMKAVQEEDFQRAAEIKQLQAELLKHGKGVSDGARASKAVELNCELDRVLREKKEAADSEDFDRASTLRKRAVEIEQLLQEESKDLSTTVSRSGTDLSQGDRVAAKKEDGKEPRRHRGSSSITNS